MCFGELSLVAEWRRYSLQDLDNRKGEVGVVVLAPAHAKPWRALSVQLPTCGDLDSMHLGGIGDLGGYKMSQVVPMAAGLWDLLASMSSSSDIVGDKLVLRLCTL
jgi:hypothetical protein